MWVTVSYKESMPTLNTSIRRPGFSGYEKPASCLDVFNDLIGSYFHVNQVSLFDSKVILGHSPNQA